MINGWLRRIVLAAMIAVTGPAALADAWDALRAPGTVALMRHALAPGTGDPADFTLGDCSTQRNLDERGRAQARAVGDAFRANDIAVDRVLTSQWCRCRETAELLALAPVEDLPALNSFFADRSTRAAQTAAVRALLADLPDATRAVLVTHFVNIRALTGRAVSSGDIVVVTVDDDGAVTVRGEIAVAP
jgi:phosphohistidine phosphatase SixA